MIRQSGRSPTIRTRKEVRMHEIVSSNQSPRVYLAFVWHSRAGTGNRFHQERDKLIWRAGTMRRSSGIAHWTSLLILILATAQAGAMKRPHIVFILADDLASCLLSEKNKNSASKVKESQARRIPWIPRLSCAEIIPRCRYED